MTAFPKPKPKKKKYSQRIADTYFSLFIRNRGVCQGKGLDHVHCGGSLQCAHIIGRSNKRLRYDPDNVLCLCAGHHRYYTTHAYEWFTLFIPNHFPAQFAYISRHRLEMTKNSTQRLREVIEHLDFELDRLGIEH